MIRKFIPKRTYSNNRKLFKLVLPNKKREQPYHNLERGKPTTISKKTDGPWITEPVGKPLMYRTPTGTDVSTYKLQHLWPTTNISIYINIQLFITI